MGLCDEYVKNRETGTRYVQVDSCMRRVAMLDEPRIFFFLFSWSFWNAFSVVSHFLWHHFVCCICCNYDTSRMIA